MKIKCKRKRKRNIDLAVVASQIPGRVIHDNDSILIVVDRLTKMVHFVPTTERTTAEGLTRLFRDNIWRLHGLPKSIISDRSPQFAAGLIRKLDGLLGILTKLLTAFYSQTDG